MQVLLHVWGCKVWGSGSAKCSESGRGGGVQEGHGIHQHPHTAGSQAGSLSAPPLHRCPPVCITQQQAQASEGEQSLCIACRGRQALRQGREEGAKQGAAEAVARCIQQQGRRGRLRKHGTGCSCGITQGRG